MLLKIFEKFRKNSEKIQKKFRKNSVHENEILSHGHGGHAG